MMTATDTSRPSRRFRRTRGEIAFYAASVIWAVVMIATGASAWPIAMWITTALIPFSLHRNRTDSAKSHSSKGTPR
ncbi:MAG: hypothetical protein AB8G14_18955 [Ilumatobacter sp.]